MIQGTDMLKKYLILVLIISLSIIPIACNRNESQTTTETLQQLDTVETSSTQEATKTAISSTSTVVTATKETTVKRTEPTTVATTTETTVKPTEPKPTTTKPTTAPTTTATTQATAKPTSASLPADGKLDSTTFVTQAFTEVNKMRAEVGAKPIAMLPQLVQDYAMLRAKEESDQYASTGAIDNRRPDGTLAMDYIEHLMSIGTLQNAAKAELISHKVGNNVNGISLVRKLQSAPSLYEAIITEDLDSVAIGYAFDETTGRHFIVIIKTHVPPPPSGKLDTATFVAQAFAEVNLMRSEVGASPVVMSPQLVQDYAMLRAREEAEQYAAEGIIDHRRPDGSSAMTYLRDC